jgi:hypothetical protein
MSSGLRLVLGFLTILFLFAVGACNGLGWIWFWTLAAILIIVLIAEVVAIRRTGMSLSRRFKTWAKEHLGWSTIILISSILFVLYLSGHLKWGW